MPHSCETSEISVIIEQQAQDCRDFYLNEKYADVLFVFTENGNEIRIPAHKSLLACYSPVFDVMFDGRWIEKSEVKIVDASVAVFKEFLQLFYLNQVGISNEFIYDISSLADKYDVAGYMSSEWKESLLEKMTLDTVCAALDLAIRFDRSKLKYHCLKKVGQETSAVLTSQAFLRCSSDALKCMLESDGIRRVASTVFDGCISWAKHACERDKVESSVENCRKQLGDLLYKIPFDRMKAQDVIDCVEKNKDFFTGEELEDLLSVAKPDRLQLKLFRSTRIETWKDDSVLECWLYADFGFRDSMLQKRLKLTFQVNKMMIFGAISTVRLYDNCPWTCTHNFVANIFISETASNQTEGMVILQQTVRFFVTTENQRSTLTKCNFTKFDEPILVEPKNHYHIYVDVLHNSFQYKYNRSNTRYSEKTFSEDYKINITLDDGFIACLYFNP